MHRGKNEWMFVFLHSKKEKAVLSENQVH